MRSTRGGRLLAVFADLSLAAKIVCLVGLLGVISLAISLYANANMRGIDKSYRGLIDNEARGALLISDTSLVLAEASRLVYAVLTEQEEAAMRAVQYELLGLEGELDGHLALLREVLPHKEPELNVMAWQARDVFRLAQAIVDSAARWRGDRALLIIHDEFEPALRQLRAGMDSLRNASINAFRHTAVDLSQATNQTILSSTVAVGTGLILVLVLSVYLTITQISRPITALTRTMRRLTDRVYDDEILGTWRRDEVGTMAQTLQVFRDTMREAERLSAQVAASDQARRVSEQIAQEKAAFLAVMSHEIRTPLNAMLGMAQLMLKSELAAPQRERVQALLRAGHHLRGIVDDILDLSKIDHGKLLIEATDFELRQVLADILEMIQPRASAKGLRLSIEVAPDVPAMLVGDPLRIRQILLNYVGNAVKFTDRGQIDVMLSMSPADDAGGLWLRGQVRDSGIGMDEEQVGRLFQAFHQADASITRRFGGTGLGLAISRRLAELMGGEAGVSSTPGRGSTFWFTARVRSSRLVQPPPRLMAAGPEDSSRGLLAAAMALPPPCNTEALRGLRVLVVDDNPMNRVVATGLLESGGVLADVAVDGQDAIDTLEAARDGTYALVLMDMQMPVLDGLSATRRLRADPRFAALPIVAMTANASAWDRDATAAAGMDAHLAKPVEESRMWATLAQVLAARAANLGREPGQPSGTGTTPETTARPTAEQAEAALSAGRQPEEASETTALSTAEWTDTMPSGRQPGVTTETRPDLAEGALRVFNPAPLQDLQQRFSTERFQALLAMFREDCLARAARIGEAAARADSEAIRRDAHDLVSTAGNFGLLTLSALGRTLREAARVGDETRMRDVAVQVQLATAEGLQALWQRFPEAAPAGELPA